MAVEEDSEELLQTEDLAALTGEEKRFLLLVERGDVANVKRLIDTYRGQPEVLLIDCVDPLGRSGLTVSIENENYELIQLLLEEGVKVKDALLHAIKEEYVEAVELLLEWEEQHHESGTPYSWEAADRDTATFTPDITPLILAAHKNNYEIIKILLDRGASLPLPHDVKCGCDVCVTASSEDSLRYSRARINAYRALASPSLICLSSKDPFLTAFELSWELRRLAKVEAEFRADYNELRAQCQDFATTLLGHARTSVELQTLLNHQATKTRVADEGWEPGEKQGLERLKLAIKYKQKKFVAHPSVQQLLAAMWYEGLPGFRRKTLSAQLMDVAQLGAMFPMYCFNYMINPESEKGKFLKKPFVKFICHSSSYVTFLTLLAAASQRVEFVILDFFGNDWMHEILEEWERKERGALPGVVETAIIIYIQGWIWAEIKSLWSDGLVEYISDLWNVVDFITNTLYVTWVVLRATAVFCVMRESWEGKDPYYPRESWDDFDPMLLSEGMFGAAMIFSFLKLVHIFSINPHLGPLQISLGRMIVDILKFFFIYTLVLFAFGCGLNQLLWYYADLEKSKCYSLENNQPNYDAGDSCFIWRRFANLFETSQSLFWASFGLVELDAFELTGIKSFTRFWGLLMFGSYSVINVIVLLNMLIAMMSTSYQIISERSDTEWKFARSKLWISYFDEGGTVPAPFNVIPTFKSLKRLIGCGKGLTRKPSGKRRGALKRYLHITRLLVRRYVSAEENRKQEEAGITEDDVNEIRQDISSFRYELLDVLKTNGMRTPNLQPGAAIVAGRKGKVMERRLMKDFQIGVIEAAVKEAIVADEGNTKDMFARIARAIGGKKQKKDWNEMVRKASVRADPIGSKQTSLRRRKASVRRRRVEAENAALFSMDPDQLAEYNPKLQELSAATRVAYAKFKTKMLISHINEADDDSEPATPAEQPKVNAETRAAKAQSLRISKRASIVKQQQAQAAGRSSASKKLAKGVSLDPSCIDKASEDTTASADPLPILETIHKEIEKVKKASGSKKEKATSESPTSPVAAEDIKKGEGSSAGQSTSSAKKTEFTVVQIETKQPKDTEPEEEGEPSKPAGAEEMKKKPLLKSTSPTGSEELEQTLKVKDTERKGSTASASSLTSPPGPPRSPSPTGKSAVTGQTRTGWI
ncbi:unnamed protein product [Orchesella dallaii]